MRLAVDVTYRAESARAAGVLFSDWATAVPTDEYTLHIPTVAAYEPGAFYKRELPCLLALLEQVRAPLTTVIVDGFVDLGPQHTPGLGRFLFEALDERVPIIGVAKSPFKDTPAELALWRGHSQRPLWVGAAGMPLTAAHATIQRMHGPYRLPTLLKRVDQLCRGL